MPSPPRVAASAARIFSRRDKVLLGLLEELNASGPPSVRHQPIDTSTPTGDREKPWKVRQHRLLDSLERRGVTPYRRPHGHDYLGRMDIETEVSIGSLNWHG